MRQENLIPVSYTHLVPTPTGSTTILTAVVKKAGVTKEDINAAMKSAANESFGYNEDEIVSSDIVGMRFGSLFDATQTMVNQVSDDLYEVQVDVYKRQLSESLLTDFA